MSARSSARELALLACLIGAGACGSKKGPPEADPAAFLKIAGSMVKNVPLPAGVPNCKPEELVGPTMTRRTLLLIDHVEIEKIADLADWMNPVELDAPAARVLADPSSDETAKRQASAELLAAPGYLVYRLDLVAAPLALGVKDLKIGTVGGRLIHYDKRGQPTCVTLFTFQNDKAKSDAAIERARAGTVVDMAIVNEMRADLRDQYLIHAPRPVTAPATE